MPDPEIDSTKNFQFRAVPAELHYKWKIIAAFTGKSMEAIGLEGIALHIVKLMDERKEELKEVGEELRKEEANVKGE